MRHQFGIPTRALVVGATAFLSVVSASAADLTVGAFGGIWEQSLRKCVVEPFEKRTGKKVDVVLGAPVQWLNQIAASPNKPPIDVIYNPSETSYDAIDRGLVDPLTPEKVPNVANIRPEFKDLGKGYGNIVGVLSRKAARSMLLLVIVVVAIWFIGKFVPGGFIPDEDKGYQKTAVMQVSSHLLPFMELINLTW